MINQKILNTIQLLILSFIQLMLAKGAETLPNKVAHDYKALAKFYDAKNYRKGLKNAEKILEKHPDHPQTNAMKALFELGLGQQAKAQVTAKMALMKSRMTSMFCWHTYGTVMKHKKNFPQAAKCFAQALNFEKDNMQLLRETACLQIQVRDHNNHVATRYKILQLKPNMIHNWVGFAVAHHLKGDYDQLFKALGSIENLRLSIQMKPVQISHYQVYRAIAFGDGQAYDKMHQQLVKNKEKIMDEDVWNQLMYKCCLKLNKIEDAKKHKQFLIKKYPQNTEYFKQYQELCNVPERDLYIKLRTQFKSKIAKIYELCAIPNKQQFKKQFLQFIKPYFQKNLISLFAQIQVIYEKTKHSDEIEEVFLQSQASLKNNKYPDGTDTQFPTEHLWALYLLAQHYSRKFQTLKKAHEYIVKAIQHTQTVTEFYIVKAEIEYKMHNNIEAIKTINEARKTDLADRYMNNICIKYLLKCMKPSLAEDILKLFMRDEASLYELQNQWYIIEAGKSFLKLRNLPAGLRHLYFVQKQFQDIQANQYDFHTYCIRKWTLREYLQYISFNDNIYKDKKYVEAAGYAMEWLPEYAHQLQLQANKPKEEETKDDEAKKKKKKNKNKPVQQQKLTPVEAFRKKIDYFGKEYSQRIRANPMEQALTYAKNVTSAKYVNKQNKKQNRLYAKAFYNAIKVFIHYNKPLLVIRALKKLIKTQAQPYLTSFTVIKSITYLQSALANQKTNQLTKQFIKQYLGELLGKSTNARQHFGVISQNLPEIYNKQTRIGEIQLALNNKDTRQNFVQFYKSELDKIINSQNKDIRSLQSAFYLCHRLQFFDQLSTQSKVKLNQIFGDQTTYFTNWFEAIDALPSSTWGLFWLSEYDIKREQKGEEELQKQISKQQTKQPQQKKQQPKPSTTAQK